jgi:hypothetical protein
VPVIPPIKILPPYFVHCAIRLTPPPPVHCCRRNEPDSGDKMPDNSNVSAACIHVALRACQASCPVHTSITHCLTACANNDLLATDGPSFQLLNHSSVFSVGDFGALLMPAR